MCSALEAAVLRGCCSHSQVPEHHAQTCLCASWRCSALYEARRETCSVPAPPEGEEGARRISRAWSARLSWKGHDLNHRCHCQGMWDLRTLQTMQQMRNSFFKQTLYQPQAFDQTSLLCFHNEHLCPDPSHSKLNLCKSQAKHQNLEIWCWFFHFILARSGNHAPRTRPLLPQVRPEALHTAPPVRLPSHLTPPCPPSLRQRGGFSTVAVTRSLCCSEMGGREFGARRWQGNARPRDRSFNSRLRQASEETIPDQLARLRCVSCRAGRCLCPAGCLLGAVVQPHWGRCGRTHQ